jgi:hypothetical protein
MTEYLATWLQGEEIFQVMEQQGLPEPDARCWLERAITDRGIVCDRPADSQKDLFRIPHIVRGYRGQLWIAKVDAIDWQNFSIDAPHEIRRIFMPVPIQASHAVLLQLLATRPTNVGQSARQLDDDEKSAERRHRAVEARLKIKKPGRTETWQVFYDAIRDDAGGWIDKAKGQMVKGFSDSAIKRTVKDIVQ